MNTCRFIVFVFTLVMLLGFVSAADLNVKLTASVNSLSGEFTASTLSNAENGFDGYDAPIISLPSNYVIFYSNITADSSVGFDGRLAQDFWNASSNPRTLLLSVFVNPSVSSKDLVIIRSGSYEGYHIILKDYGSNSNRQTLISTTNLTSQSSYTITGFSGSYRYFTLEVSNTSTASVPDTTPPASVTNLKVKRTTSSSITWNWTNPTDDFYQAILYFNEENVVNTSSDQFTVSGLLASTSYTLKVRTKDSVGNVNTVDVSSSGTTNASSVVPGTTPGPGTGTGGTGGTGTGSGNKSSSGVSNVISNLSGKIGLVYGLIGVGVVIVIAIIIIIIKMIVRHKTHHLNKQVHIHQHHLKLLRKKKI